MSIVTESPRGNCVLGGVNAVLSAMNRVCPIYHSGPGCCMQTSAGEAGQAGGRTPHFLSSVSLPSSNMLEREVVFGGIDKLRDTISGALEVIDADSYFVLTGCTAGIIGDDIKGVVKEFKDKGIEIYHVDTPGFAGDSYLGYEAIFRLFLEQIVSKEYKKQDNLVNILGIMPYHDPYWSGNLEEISRILKRLGLQVNTFFTEHQGLEEIRKSSNAALNIIINPWLLKGVEDEYKERFGIQSLRLPGIPIGATDTTEFIRKVGDALSISNEMIERVIYEEEEYIYNYFETAIGTLSWKRFGVVADANMSLGITRFLANDYSFTPQVVIITDFVFREEDKKRILDAVKNLEYAKAPEVFFENDQYKITKILEQFPDITLLLGSTNEREYAMEKDIQCSTVSFPITDRLIFNRTYAGYKGCLTLVEDLYDNL